MGLLQEGKWVDRWYDTKKEGGHFVRKEAQFRNWITADGVGLLQEGKWVDQWYDTKKEGGHFVRKEAQFRNWITADGAAGPSGAGGFKAEAGRYHLCWAKRRRRLQGRGGALSPLRIFGLPLGASNADFSRAEGFGRYDFRLYRSLVYGREWLDV